MTVNITIAAPLGSRKGGGTALFFHVRSRERIDKNVSPPSASPEVLSGWAALSHHLTVYAASSGEHHHRCPPWTEEMELREVLQVARGHTAADCPYRGRSFRQLDQKGLQGASLLLFPRGSPCLLGGEFGAVMGVDRG